jgi:hypothetical protein
MGAAIGYMLFSSNTSIYILYTTGVSKSYLWVGGSREIGPKRGATSGLTSSYKFL